MGEVWVAFGQNNWEGPQMLGIYDTKLAAYAGIEAFKAQHPYPGGMDKYRVEAHPVQGTGRVVPGNGEERTSPNEEGSLPSKQSSPG